MHFNESLSVLEHAPAVVGRRGASLSLGRFRTAHARRADVTSVVVAATGSATSPDRKK